MKTTYQPRPEVDAWQAIEPRMRVVRLTPLLQLAVPGLAIPSMSKSVRGLTLYPGRLGFALGGLLVLSSALAGALLARTAGPVGAVLPVWLIGTAGAATMAGSLNPVAFVKPICVRCRLLPIIKEHEAMHISGISSEKSVWDSMRTRHSVESLSLEGDPAICSFCPIPKRLAEH